MATSRLPQFNLNVARARELVGLGVAVSGITSGSVNSSDMYRSALVQGVAALDAYVHDVVLDFTIEILRGIRPPGTAGRIGLHFGAVCDLLNAPGAVEFELMARELVNQRLSAETFQKPDDIAKAFASVGVNGIWRGAFGIGSGITTELNLVVGRRNQVVHRCDMDPAGVLGILPMEDLDALAAIGTVETVVQGIDAYL
ncbi:hypothetical protein [Millisia brevis]|uniref:hypothetical protein n=1 Tax=Millisia brevis TaxID=264148 RepID=UPI0012EE836C|nr:hypothetical protein [Millisia brevis]